MSDTPNVDDEDDNADLDDMSWHQLRREAVKLRAEVDDLEKQIDNLCEAEDADDIESDPEAEWLLAHVREALCRDAGFLGYEVEGDGVVRAVERVLARRPA